jgi:peptide/nickel transport system permease protein
MLPGCPTIHEMWQDGFAADLWLLGGAIVVGVFGGIAAGAWCATRPRSRASRLLEAAAMVAYCTPVYVMGLGLMLLFAPPFGLTQLPFFFEPHVYQSPNDNVWDWFRSLVLPWLIVGAPIAAVCLRLTLALSIDAMGEHYVRTAFAKGLPRNRVVRRHAAPTAYVSVASFLGATVPAVVTNMVLVEYVFSVPGFFRFTKRALGQAQGSPPVPDFPTLQALAIWAAVLIVIASLVADIAIAALDPRIRAGGRAAT